MSNIETPRVSKLEVMTQNQDLFRNFVKAAGRGKYLNAVVLLQDDSIEVVLFVDDESVVKQGTTGIVTSVSFNTYTEEVLQNVNTMLDCRAKDMKAKWKATYDELESHIDDENLFLDLTHKDYGILHDCNDIRTQRSYRLPWSFNGVKEAAEYIADRSIPSLDDDFED